MKPNVGPNMQVEQAWNDRFIRMFKFKVKSTKTPTSWIFVYKFHQLLPSRLWQHVIWTHVSRRPRSNMTVLFSHCNILHPNSYNFRLRLRPCTWCESKQLGLLWLQFYYRSCLWVDWKCRTWKWRTDVRAMKMLHHTYIVHKKCIEMSYYMPNAIKCL